MSIPVSIVIPPMNRAPVLWRTLESLASQDAIPEELIVVDGSPDSATAEVVAEWGAKLAPRASVRLLRADWLGAATQRVQGVAASALPFVCFSDDDILFEPDCFARLWRAMEADKGLGGVNAMITNQKYHPPGLVSRTMFALMHGRRETTYAGKVLGPAVNLLPEDRDDLPEVVPVEWLNTTCVMYRREALPDPVFDSIFAGYSMMEDLTLSLRVGKNWRLANARTARIFHDTQPGAHKADPAALAEMELVNRIYVMTKVLGRTRWRDYARLLAWEGFGLATSLVSSGGRRTLLARLKGKTRGFAAAVAGRVGKGD